MEYRHPVLCAMNVIALIYSAFTRTLGTLLSPFLVSPFSFAVPFPHLWDKEELAVAFCVGLYNDVLPFSRGDTYL